MLRWKKLEGENYGPFQGLIGEFHDFLKFLGKNKLSKELRAWERKRSVTGEARSVCYDVKYKISALPKCLLFEVKYYQKDRVGHSPMRIIGEGNFTQEVHFWKIQIKSNDGPYR